MTAAQYTLRLKRGGCLFGGVPCSAHVWISSGSTKKSKANPRGDVSFPPTKQGNLLCTRFVLLTMICLCREVFWGGEQPATSVLIYMKVMEWIMHANRIMIGFWPAQLVRLRLDWTQSVCSWSAMLRVTCRCNVCTLIC